MDFPACYPQNDGKRMIHDLAANASAKLVRLYYYDRINNRKKVTFFANDKLKQSICVSIKYIVLALKEIV